MQIRELKPQAIWRYFDEITQVPRPSGKEEKIAAYLTETARKMGLESKQDAAGNVVIYKAATPGYENAPTVILQAHMDMVCEKNEGVKHDFEHDPIETRIDGEWVKANGTTLGADNGIGIAAALSVLSDDTLVHPALEVLFTVEEETGLTGAIQLAPDMLKGQVLLNLDSEEEAELCIGCAGGVSTKAVFTYHPTLTPDSYHYFKVSIRNLRGGHSGSDIHLGRGNANQLLARYLWQVNRKHDLVLASFEGGNLHNAIPREATAVFGVHQSDKEDVRVMLNMYIADIEAEFGAEEPDFSMQLETVEEPSRCIDYQTTEALIGTLYSCPNGVISFSRDMPGLVETSTNLASVKMQSDNRIEINTSQRSSVESAKWDIAHRIEAVFSIGNAEVTHSEGYPGWKPNTESPILKTAVDTYKKLYDVTPNVVAIHAGLECGLILEKYPQLDMVSFGPTLRGVHSPDEKMHIPAVEKFYNHLVAILKALAEENK